MRLFNLNAVVSGASLGLGFAVAKQFVQEGAHVAICARNAEQLQAAEIELKKFAQAHTKIICMPTDISNPEQIKQFFQYVLKEFSSLDILVANAGIYGPKGPTETNDWDEWSRAIDINLKGTVLQCREVLPGFKQQHKGKIIILSGGGATKPLPNLSAYAASKAGVARFAETLAEEVRAFNIDVNTVAPGALNTRLLDEVIAAGPEKVGQKFYEQSLKQLAQGGTSLEQGANLCTFLASSASDGITGKLISAVWDPWIKLPSFIEQISHSDVYTLRRIVPEDRGMEWGATE